MNEQTKFTKIKIGLLVLLFVTMCSFAYFLLYSPFRINDNQLLIVTMIFTFLVISIPLYVFNEDTNNNTIKPNITSNKKNKKRSKK